MKNLILNNKIEVRKSKIHGYGVFAKEKIKKYPDFVENIEF